MVTLAHRLSIYRYFSFLRTLWTSTTEIFRIYTCWKTDKKTQPDKKHASTQLQGWIWQDLHQNINILLRFGRGLTDWAGGLMAAIAKATTAYHSNAPESFANAFPAFHVSELISLPLRYSRLKTSRSEKDRKRKTVSAKKNTLIFPTRGVIFQKVGQFSRQGNSAPALY